MSENTTDQSSQERRVGPTVSRDKWYLHARQKLSKGYKLIVARDGKKRANFWTAEKGFEMCAFEVARALVLSGEVAHTGEHPLGNVYELIQTDVPAPKAKPKAKPKPSRSSRLWRRSPSRSSPSPPTTRRRKTTSPTTPTSTTRAWRRPRRTRTTSPTSTTTRT